MNKGKEEKAENSPLLENQKKGMQKLRASTDNDFNKGYDLFQKTQQKMRPAYWVCMMMGTIDLIWGGTCELANVVFDKAWMSKSSLILCMSNAFILFTLALILLVAKHESPPKKWKALCDPKLWGAVLMVLGVGCIGVDIGMIIAFPKNSTPGDHLKLIFLSVAFTLLVIGFMVNRFCSNKADIENTDIENTVIEETDIEKTGIENISCGAPTDILRSSDTQRTATTL